MWLKRTDYEKLRLLNPHTVPPITPQQQIKAEFSNMISDFTAYRIYRSRLKHTAYCSPLEEVFENTLNTAYDLVQLDKAISEHKHYGHYMENR